MYSLNVLLDLNNAKVNLHNDDLRPGLKPDEMQFK